MYVAVPYPLSAIPSFNEVVSTFGSLIYFLFASTKFLPSTCTMNFLNAKSYFGINIITFSKSSSSSCPGI